RDPDVLDTWFSSALWPLSTMGWPDPGQDPQFAGLLDAFKPTSVLCTARDIITLWVSRMVMFNRFFEDGRVPFREVYIHPVIQDGDGKRMSKSAGNGVDPLDIIRTHGADAMRFTLCGMASQTQDVRLPVERDEATGVNTSPKFDLGKRFCNKLWNASRFTIGMLGQQADAPAGPVSRCDLAPIDRWMLSRLARAAARIDAALAAYEFNVYADAAYDLLWTEFCDVYLEAIKPTVQSSPSQRACLATVFESILRLLHPALPFVTEAIHEHARRSPGVPGVEGVTLGDAGALLCLAPWPRFDAGLIDAALETSTAEMLALVRLIREARQSAGVSPKRAATLHAPADLAREIAGFAGLVERLANLSGVTADEPAGPAVTIAHGARELRLSGLVEQADAGAERQRLEKALAELDAAISTLEKRLANPGYTEKAPAALVQQTRDQLAAKRAEREAVAASLEALV
ncbi:MAG: valine--tRNA ligase, partial [Planctomycetota bacterium]